MVRMDRNPPRFTPDQAILQTWGPQCGEDVAKDILGAPAVTHESRKVQKSAKTSIPRTGKTECSCKCHSSLRSTEHDVGLTNDKHAAINKKHMMRGAPYNPITGKDYKSEHGQVTRETVGAQTFHCPYACTGDRTECTALERSQENIIAPPGGYANVESNLAQSGSPQMPTSTKILAPPGGYTSAEKKVFQPEPSQVHTSTKILAPPGGYATAEKEVIGPESPPLPTSTRILAPPGGYTTAEKEVIGPGPVPLPTSTKVLAPPGGYTSVEKDLVQPESSPMPAKHKGKNAEE